MASILYLHGRPLIRPVVERAKPPGRFPSMTQNARSPPLKGATNVAIQKIAVLNKIGWMSGARSKSLRKGIAFEVITASPTTGAAVPKAEFEAALAGKETHKVARHPLIKSREPI